MRFEADFASTMKISLYIEVNYVTPFNVSDMHCTQIRLSSQQYSIESCEECKKKTEATLRIGSKKLIRRCLFIAMQ